ncbi:EAL domain-containing response regulator [Pseudomonas protegens]|jgi:EAL domain-containing protein (putative c-di-GMP-specific phosphodiesterase class I)|uniref:EAL domain-containing response regulator n=1 Tax=Pseudomonas protegens TaxID=380021 RepID=UPI003EBD2234
MTPLKILVLEEHPFERAIIVRILNHLGHDEVMQASSAVDGLSLLQQRGAVDLAICNLRINMQDSIDALTFLRDAGERQLIRSVVVSNDIANDLQCFVQQAISAMGLELLGYLGKPYNIKFMDSLLRKQLQRRLVRPPTVASLQEMPSRQQLLNAIAEQQIRAYYQPKVDLITGAAVSAEVLVRWERDDEIIQPCEFLYAIEAHGLMDDMFYALLKQGLATLCALRSNGHDFSLALNLHSSQLMNADLVKHIQEALCAHHLSGACLTFELTEEGAVDDSAGPLENLIRLRMLGCGLSIDDFGIGFSSLERLCHLPFNEIKIDGSFVRGMREKPTCKVAIENTLALAASLNMRVVAEGIETSEQRSALLKMGCILAQGYLYAKPMESTDLLLWVAQSMYASQRTVQSAR